MTEAQVRHVCELVTAWLLGTFVVGTIVGAGLYALGHWFPPAVVYAAAGLVVYAVGGRLNRVAVERRARGAR